ncbi:MAG: ABC transporter substrate-binding protein [Christensenellales bacterium]|jgi:branched-chain amino acid transport system substrate-binding protein
MVKKIITICLVAIMAVTLFACGTPASSTGGVYKVGMFNPLSGANADIGMGVLRGTQLAIKELNAEGGLLGSQIELIYYDDTGDTDQSVNCVERLVEQDKVHSIIGSTLSGNDLAVGHLVEAAAIPAVCPGTATSWLERGWTYMFRSTLSVKYNITGIMYACELLDIKTVALFNQANEYGENGSKVMTEACEAAGIQIVGKETYEEGDTDFTAQFTKLASLNADAYYLTCNTPNIGNAVRQARANGFTGYILGDQLFGSSGPKEIAGKAMENVIFSAPYVLVDDPAKGATENQRKFFQAYLDEYGELPDVEQCMRGYDAMMIIAEGVKRSGKFDGEAVRDAILSITDYEGLGGAGNTNGTFDFSVTKDGDGLMQAALYWVDADSNDILLEEVLDDLKKN